MCVRPQRDRLTFAAGCTDRYHVEGVVLKSAPARQEVTVSHGCIPGYDNASDKAGARNRTDMAEVPDESCRSSVDPSAMHRETNASGALPE